MKPNLDWQNHGACKDHTEIYEPIPYGTYRTKTARARTNAAISLCRSCPVINQCADWALQHFTDDEHIVGGMTGPQRRQLRHTLHIASPKEATA